MTQSHWNDAINLGMTQRNADQPLCAINANNFVLPKNDSGISMNSAHSTERLPLSARAKVG
jgi:hypothetical protein